MPGPSSVREATGQGGTSGLSYRISYPPFLSLKLNHREQKSPVVLSPLGMLVQDWVVNTKIEDLNYQAKVSAGGLETREVANRVGRRCLKDSGAVC